MSVGVAVISEHASPLATIGGVGAGGQNICVAHTARHLANLGYCIDILTRRAWERFTWQQISRSLADLYAKVATPAALSRPALSHGIR